MKGHLMTYQALSWEPKCHRIGLNRLSQSWDNRVTIFDNYTSTHTDICSQFYSELLGIREGIATMRLKENNFSRDFIAFPQKVRKGKHITSITLLRHNRATENRVLTLEYLHIQNGIRAFTSLLRPFLPIISNSFS